MDQKEKFEIFKKRRLLAFDEIRHIKLEPFHGCSLNCPFCGISRDKIEAMPREIFYKIIRELNPDKLRLITLCGHGEPTLCKDIELYIHELRNRFPTAVMEMYSNVEVFLRFGFKKMLDVFDSGLTHLMADLYGDDKYDIFISELKKIRGEISSRNIDVVLYKDSPYPLCTYTKPKQKRLVIAREVSSDTSDASRRRHTWGGNICEDKIEEYSGRRLEDFPLQKRCVDLLKYLTIYVSGDAMICCRDGGRAISVGNVKENSLSEIWNSDEAQIIRYLLHTKRRGMIPSCYFCTQQSFREGLYPYWGREYSEKEIEEGLKKMMRINQKSELWKNLKKIETRLPDVIQEAL